MYPKKTEPKLSIPFVIVVQVLTSPSTIQFSIYISIYIFTCSLVQLFQSTSILLERYMGLT